MAGRSQLGHMDFQWEKPEVDESSPFTKFTQHSKMAKPPSPSKQSQTNHAAPGAAKGNSLPTPSCNTSSPSKRSLFSFAAAAAQPSPLRMQSFNAPSKSIFSPSFKNQSTGSTFRNPTFTNPAFSTPQMHRFAEQDFDDSPAMTEDTSGIADSPDFDRSDIMDALSISTPQSKRITWSEKRSGKGLLPRATGVGFPHDRVRKRPRADRDKDIGSTRSRLPGGRDEDDSDYEVFKANGGKHNKEKNMGWLHYTLTAVSANPDAPIILSEYMQLFINSFLGCLVLWVVWCGFSSARDEVIYSSGKAKLALQNEIEACSLQFFSNKCDSTRMPALEDLCNEWEKCKDQDPENVAGVKAVVGHIADIINEFTTRLSWKSIFVVVVVLVAVLVANNMAFSRFRQNVRHYNHQRPADPAPSHPAVGHMSPDKLDQAYLYTPMSRKNLRRILQDDTDTDMSPDQRLLLGPSTPSRRSPSKVKWEDSPTKRSPSKQILEELDHWTQS